MATQLYTDAGQGKNRGKTSRGRADFLRRVIQWDAGMITVAALILIVMAGPIAAFMGIANPTILMAAGVMGLLYDGGRLLLSFQGDSVSRRLAQVSLYGNALWAIISIPLLAMEVLPLTNGGWWVMAGLADFAALFAVLQWYGLRQPK